MLFVIWESTILENVVIITIEKFKGTPSCALPRPLTKYDIKFVISKMNKTDKNIASLRDGSCTDSASADHEVVEGALRDIKNR